MIRTFCRRAFCGGEVEIAKVIVESNHYSILVAKFVFSQAYFSWCCSANRLAIHVPWEVFLL